MDIAELRALADTWGFEPIECGVCADGAAAAEGTTCPNCAGSGRLWVGRASTLSDVGLLRLRSTTPQSVRRDVGDDEGDD